MPEIIEGSTRINPTTGVEEFYNPLGQWVPLNVADKTVAETQEEVRDEIGIVTDEEAKDEIKEVLEIPEEPTVAREPVKLIAVQDPSGKFMKVDVNSLPELLERGFTISDKRGGLTKEEFEGLGIEGEEETPEVLALREEIEQANKDIEEMETKLDGYVTTRKDATNDLIASLRKTYEARKVAMRDINDRAIASYRTRGFRTGALRYSDTFQGIISAEERLGEKRIADIENEMNLLIAEAKQNQADKDYNSLYNKIDRLQDRQEDKVKALKSMLKVAQKKNNEVESQKEKIRKTNNMLVAWDAGAKDFSSLFVAMNYVDGKFVEDYSDGEIQDFLDMVEVEEDKDAAFTNLQKLKLEQAGLLNATRENQLDFLLKEKEEVLGRTNTQTLKVMGITGKTEEEVKAMSDLEFADHLYRGTDTALLSINQVEKFQKLYPDAGVEVGDTATTANEKVFGTRNQSLIDLGYNESEIKDIRESSLAPSWFVNDIRGEYGLLFSAKGLNDLWVEFVNKLTGATTEEDITIEPQSGLEKLKSEIGG